jgi:hypothetical protein
MNNMKRIKQLAIAAIFLLALTARNTTAQQLRPGGVNNSNYTWYAWLTPESYSSGVWNNNISGGSSIGNFYAPRIAPSKLNSGYNFHPSVQSYQ